MKKLSTATGYIYGYVQDLESGMWQYIILDFETGETVFTMDVSNKYGYNNMAIGMYAGNSAELKLYAYGADGRLAAVDNALWSITDETGSTVDTLSAGTLYELRVSVADGGALDLSEAEKEIIISVVLAK